MTQSNARRHRIALGVLVTAGSLLATACGGGGGDTGGGGANAAGGGSCYQGKTLTFVVPFSPGGGYDLIARAAAPSLEDELKATVVVENQEGAGGLTAANRIFTDKPNGMSIGLFAGQGLIGSVLGGAAGVRFDPEKFTYIGRLAQDQRVLLVSPKSGFKRLEDLQAAPEVRYATAGPGAADHIDATVMIPVLGLKGKIITGYKGSSETELAVTSGAVQAGSGTLGTRLESIKNGSQRAVLLIGKERAEDLPDTPALMELDLGAEQRALAEAHTQLQEVGRLVMGPPGMPSNCVEELENAFKTTLDSEKFKKAMAKADVPFEFVGGDEIKQVVSKVLDAPEPYKNLLKASYRGQGR